MAVAVALLTVAVGVLAVLVLGLLRSHAEILRGLHELGVSLDPDAEPGPRTAAGIPGPRRRGAEAGADISGITPDGAAASVGVVGTDRRTLLAFLTSGCLTCRGFWSAFADGVTLDGARVVVVTKGPGGESQSAVAALAPRGVTTVLSDEAWRHYGVEVAPYFVLVEGSTGAVVGEGAAATWDQVRRLMSQAQADVDADGITRAEAALRAAGIEPGDPALYHEAGEAGA
jgi:hypothetical protein